MLSKKQKDFLINPLNRINLLYGSVRSGKTWISLLKWALWIGQQPLTNEFLMVGKTITSLKRNCLGLLQELIGDNLTFTISQKQATIFGHTVWLEGANDERAESKIRGMTLKGCYIDELTQIPESFYLMVLSRLSEPNACLIATTNPDAPTHYVKTKILDNIKINKNVIKFVLDDNIFLDEEYKNNLKKEYTGVYYQRFILGDFVRAEGIVFREFAENTNSYTIDSIPQDEYIRFLGLGFDLGGNNSKHALVSTAITNKNNVYVLKSKSIEPQNLKFEEIENECKKFIVEIEKKYKTRFDSAYVDDAYYTLINSLNDFRYIFGNAAAIKSSMPLNDRPIFLSRLMAKQKFKLIKGECDSLIEELQNAVFDKKSDKAIICDDGTQTIDQIDALFYSIADEYLYILQEDEK